MKNVLKKVISIFLSLTLLLGVVPVFAQAVRAESTEIPYVHVCSDETCNPCAAELIEIVADPPDPTIDEIVLSGAPIETIPLYAQPDIAPPQPQPAGASIRVVEFQITPNGIAEDVTIGIGGTAESAEYQPIAIRIADGYFTAANGDGFAYVNTIPYTIGTIYHVKAMINLPIGTYDIWITEGFPEGGYDNFGVPGGTPVQLAKDFRLSNFMTTVTDDVILFGVNAENIVITGARLIPNAFGSVPMGNLEGNHAIESDNTARFMTYRFDIMYTASGIIDHQFGLGDGDHTVSTFAQLIYLLGVSNNVPYIAAHNGTSWVTNLTIDHPRAGLRYSTADFLTFSINMSIDQELRRWRAWGVSPEGNIVEITGNFPTDGDWGFQARNFASPTIPFNNLNMFHLFSAVAGQVKVTNAVMLYTAQLENAIAAVNNASTADEIGAAITSISLGLPLAWYGKLTASQQASINEQMLNIRNSRAFICDLDIQFTLNNLVREATTDRLPAPEEFALALLQEDNVAVFTWDHVPGAVFYELYRSVGNTFNPATATRIARTRSTSANDFDLFSLTEYTWAIRAVDGLDFRSEWSDTVTTVTRDTFLPFGRQTMAHAIASDDIWFSFQRINTVYTGFNPVGIIDAPVYFVCEWNGSGMVIAEALKYLAIFAPEHSDHRASPDGESIGEAILRQIRSLIRGGREFGGASGLNAHGSAPAVAALTLVRTQSPHLWNQLTAEERYKVTLLMEGALIGAHYGYADVNWNSQFSNGQFARNSVPWAYGPSADGMGGGSSIDQAGNHSPRNNPNFSNGIMNAVFAFHFFNHDDYGNVTGQGEAIANSILQNFCFDTFTGRLRDAGFTSMLTVFQNAGNAPPLGQPGSDNSDGRAHARHMTSVWYSTAGVYGNQPVNFTYFGYPLSQSGRWVQAYINFNTAGGPMRPHGGETGTLHQTAGVATRSHDFRFNFEHGYRGWMAGGDAALLNFPNLGAQGMSQEFDGWDNGGGRSSLSYGTYILRGNADGMLALLVFGLEGLTVEEHQALMRHTSASAMDMRFKGVHLYNSWQNTNLVLTQAFNIQGEIFVLDAWDMIINNPVEPMAAVNNADLSSMRAVLENPALGLIMYQYDGLRLSSSKDAVAQAVYQGRPFANKLAVQEALMHAVWEQAVIEFNELVVADDTASVLHALTVRLLPVKEVFNLGPDITVYDTPNALGIFVYGFTDLLFLPVSMGGLLEAQDYQLAIAQHIINNAPTGEFADRAGIRNALTAAVAAVPLDLGREVLTGITMPTPFTLPNFAATNLDARNMLQAAIPYVSVTTTGETTSLPITWSYVAIDNRNAAFNSANGAVHNFRWTIVLGDIAPGRQLFTGIVSITNASHVACCTDYPDCNCAFYEYLAWRAYVEYREWRHQQYLAWVAYVEYLEWRHQQYLEWRAYVEYRAWRHEQYLAWRAYLEWRDWLCATGQCNGCDICD